ncbi:GtrA family protein [Aurantiacibacter hainanensis]|uniref:GtrA family protein n=1 Tax=Aurantiacibacter hainanensis TaxID=3076114 RepID=UPI0030C6599F
MAALTMPRHYRFIAAGAINTGFGLGFYPLLVWSTDYLHRHYLLALGIAQVVCLAFAFAIYKFGVFRTRGRVGREFGAFSTFYLFNYAANWGALPVLVELGGISPVVAQTSFTLLLIAGSWFWHSRITFRGAEDK